MQRNLGDLTSEYSHTLSLVRRYKPHHKLWPAHRPWVAHSQLDSAEILTPLVMLGPQSSIGTGKSLAKLELVMEIGQGKAASSALTQFDFAQQKFTLSSLSAGVSS